ncbi:hypothetical protein Bca4012_016106 [Brassica carinata]
MLDIAYELVGQATSNSLLMFCFCNIIIVIIITGSSKPGSMDSQDYSFTTTSVSFNMCNNLASEDHDCGDGDDDEMVVVDVSSEQDESLTEASSISDGDKESSHCCDDDDEEEEEEDEDEDDESNEEDVEEDEEDDELRKRAEEFIAKTMMDPNMFAEDPSYAEKFDIDFEFDAPRFFDFSKPELDSETEETELWFESAGNYPPSPFSLNLNCRLEDTHLKIPKPISDKYNGITRNSSISRLEQTPFVHKVPKKVSKVTVPKEPNLKTAQRAAKQRFKANSAPEQVQESSLTSLHKKNTPRSQDFQGFHLRTSLRAKERSSNAKNAPVDVPTHSLTSKSVGSRKVRKVKESLSSKTINSQVYDSKISHLESKASSKFGEAIEIKHENNFPRMENHRCFSALKEFEAPKVTNSQDEHFIESLRKAGMSRSSRMASLQLLSLLFFFFSMSRSIDVSKPHAVESFSLIQNFGSCRYTVIIKTSCSSPRYTRDQISLSFGDGYRNQVYAPRLDDPGSRAFERCSSDTYEINGPCV